MMLGTNNHAFITGGASGIGLGIADALVKRGVRVTIADINADALAQVLATRGNALRGVLLDVRDRDDWQAAKARAEEVFGPVDILVNNAGIAPDGLELADSAPESFERIIGINFMGVYNGIVTFGAGVRERGGHILNVASMAGLSSERATTGAYSASKYAVVSLSETLRVEMQPHGVGVSVMCPGLVMTNLPENTARIGGNLRPGGKMPGGLDPAVAGEMAARGIERGDFYILTSFDRDEPIRRRFEEQLAAFARGPDKDLVGS
ncbi:MAG: SDR family NAD(P)-dependent oxidoreductase [Novosphingobium sp.]